MHLRHLLLACLFFFPTLAHAAEPQSLTRMRLTVHKEHHFFHRTELASKFTFTDDVLARRTPILAIGLKREATSWLSLELLGGWATAKQEPIIELALLPHGKSLWGSLSAEWRTTSNHSYWFAQAEYTLHNTWLHAGWENELWGSMSDDEPWNIRTGPNIILRFKTVEMDFALHARDVHKQTSPEFAARFHLYL